mgnify:CR=1 FL=1
MVVNVYFFNPKGWDVARQVLVGTLKALIVSNLSVEGKELKLDDVEVVSHRSREDHQHHDGDPLIVINTDCLVERQADLGLITLEITKGLTFLKDKYGLQASVKIHQSPSLMHKS